MYYISRNYRSKFDAAGKAKMDCETILDDNGWKNIGFKQTWISNAILGTIISALGITYALIRLNSKSTLCLQYPLHKFYNYILWGARLKKCTIITIVHDVNSLKGKIHKTKSELHTLSKSTNLILHNQAMRQWFESNNITAKIIELHIFDYLHTTVHNIAKKNIDFDMYRVVFAGNMSKFIYLLDNIERANFKFDLYGIGFNPNYIKNPNNTLLDYKGFYKSNEIIDYIDGDFGLVWYGDSLYSCDGETGQYLKFNNPHKLSLYIQCEMPIIIWDKAAMASFVTKNNIGITVSSLTEIKDKLASLSENNFHLMKNNVLKIKSKISKGYYLKSALKEII